MATVVHGPAGAVAAVMLGSLSTAFSDVVVDSIVVERARGGPQVCTAAIEVMSTRAPRLRPQSRHLAQLLAATRPQCRVLHGIKAAG